MSDTPRIYVASLADYNAGRLHGKWIDADQDAESIYAEVKEMLAASTEPVAEEWAIHDHDGFGEYNLSEYESFETVANLGIGIAEHGEAYAGFVAHQGGLEYASLEDFDEQYRGHYKDEEDFAYEFVDELGYLDDLPDTISSYFDYEKFARDLFIGDFYSVNSSEGGIHVFWRH